MKDKWINSGYDGKELKPFSEPVEDLNDTTRIGRNDLLSNFKPKLPRFLLVSVEFCQHLFTCDLC